MLSIKSSNADMLRHTVHVRMGTTRCGRSVVRLLVCVIMVLCIERCGCEVGYERSPGLRFDDWRRVFAIEKWRQDVDYEGERERLQRWLAPDDKWHFVMGYSDVTRASSAVRRLGLCIHHLPIRNSSVHFILTFMSAASADLVRRRHHRVFHVVEPLLPYLKIEDLTLGSIIRNEEDVAFHHDITIALKAMFAHSALTLREAHILAAKWEVALRVMSFDLSYEEQTMRYTDAEGQMGMIEEMGDYMPVQTAYDVIECRASVTAVVCSGITKKSVRGAANFMAAHAVVQLVELNPRYEVFNKWAKYVTQVRQYVTQLADHAEDHSSRVLLIIALNLCAYQSVSGTHLPIFNNGLRGQGEVIACADTGIDMDHCFFRDRDRAVPFNAVDLEARKVVQYVMSWGDNTDFGGGHGTHVAGSIAGDTEDGSNEFGGMAPAAKIAFFDLGSNATNLKAPNELGEGVFDHGYMAGARIFSNSWGVLRQGYSSNAHEVDSFSYLNEDVLILFAVGNQGRLGKGTVASPASSKNCLAVGASFNAAASLASQSEEYSRNDMKPSTVAPFSGAGPTFDGRIKPDVLAPGMVVWSSVPDFGRGSNCQVGPKQGTSSATPLVAGLAALARQYFREGYYPSGKKNINDGFIPSGALLKAVMIHSAVPEHRYVNSTSGMSSDLQLAPDYVEGFGLVVLEKVLVFAKPSSSKNQPSRLIVWSGRRDGAVAKHETFQTVTIKVISSKEPLRVTMVWMDPPAAPGSLHPMVNDLNLKLQDPNKKIIYPNGLNEEDSINNVEYIHVIEPKKGQWKVTVEGARVVNDIQPYALVATGHVSSTGPPVTLSNSLSGTNSVENVTSAAESTKWQNRHLFCLILLQIFSSQLFWFPLTEISKIRPALQFGLK